MLDYTGKAGIGKRYLDEQGNFMPITSLPEEKQKEILANSREIARQQNEVRRRKNKEMLAYEDENKEDKLLNIIENQSRLIDRLESRLDSIESGNDIKDEVVEPEVKLTRKEALLAEALDLGLVVDEKNTIKELERMISEETQEVISDGDPRFED